MNNREEIQAIKHNVCEYCEAFFVNPKYTDRCTRDKCNIKCAIEALERAEKYRWHDLRKNPKDLPKPEDESVFYECVLRGSCNAPYYPHFQFCDGEWGTWEDVINPFSVSVDGRAFAPIGDTFGEVIAWREKEPFEEATCAE